MKKKLALLAGMALLVLGFWALWRQVSPCDEVDSAPRREPVAEATSPELQSRPVAPPAGPRTVADDILELVVKHDLPEEAYRRERIQYLVERVGADAARKIFAGHMAESGSDFYAVSGILQDMNKAVVAGLCQEARRARQDDPDLLVLDGLIADRKARRIRMFAQATGLSSMGQPPEFFIVSATSGHDYEATSTALCQPSDLHRAMEFIGVAPGRPVRYDQLQFWPKGERALFTLTARLDQENTIGPIPLEHLFLNVDSGKPLPNIGMVFTGSLMLPEKEGSDRMVYAADTFDPRAIAASYNEPTSVFDVPRRAYKSEVYRKIAVNPEYKLPPMALFEIEIVPEYEAGRLRVRELDLAVLPAADGGIATTLRERKGDVILERVQIARVLEYAVAEIEAGRDPFVEVHFNDAVSLAGARAISAVLAGADTENGLRIEGPPPGALYYKAFIPDSGLKDRSRHYVHPLELRLIRKESGLSGTLTRIRAEWADRTQVKPTLSTADYAVADGADLRTRLDSMESAIDVLLVFAPEAVTVGELMRFVAPALTTHPILHVYAQSAADTDADVK